MKLTREVVFRRLTVALATLTIAGCTSSAATYTAVSIPGPHHEAPLSVRLIVSPTIVSGSGVTAHLIIDNRTGHAIPVSDCNLEAFQVLLENQSYHLGPGWLQCLTTDSIPAGVSVRATLVQASVNTCVAGRTTVPAVFRCTSRGTVPALPPGTYHARVFPVSPGLPSAPEVTVRVLAAG